ncbi:TPA: hypothetical protein J1Z11_002164 [Escherichia coli]|nr:hypothetical protein [Escherichia coli]
MNNSNFFNVGVWPEVEIGTTERYDHIASKYQGSDDFLRADPETWDFIITISNGSDNTINFYIKGGEIN